MKRLYLIPLFAALLWGATIINGDRAIVGKWDASGATATLPFQTGTASSVPASCLPGQVYFATDAVPARRIQTCAAPNTWTPVAYQQGTAAQLPPSCATGQMYFATDATAGQNLYFCTAADTWRQMSGGGSVGGPVFSVAGSGGWWPFGRNFTAANTYNAGSNSVQAWQMTLPFGGVFRKITFQVKIASGTACAGGSCGLVFGIYAADATCSVRYGVTTPLVSGVAPDINSVSGSAISATFSSPITLNPGVYLLAQTSDSAAIVLQGIGDQMTSFENANAARRTRFTSISSTGNGAGLTLPANCPSGLTANNGYLPPVVFLEP
jgi:hypothetical protein